MAGRLRIPGQHDVRGAASRFAEPVACQDCCNFAAARVSGGDEVYAAVTSCGVVAPAVRIDTAHALVLAPVHKKETAK
jgi:hypothetical protein